jgi:hypothetical protein
LGGDHGFRVKMQGRQACIHTYTCTYEIPATSITIGRLTVIPSQSQVLDSQVGERSGRLALELCLLHTCTRNIDLPYHIRQHLQQHLQRLKLKASKQGRGGCDLLESMRLACLIPSRYLCNIICNIKRSAYPLFPSLICH